MPVKKANRLVQILSVVMPVVGLICIVIFPPWNGILTWVAPLPDTVQEQVNTATRRGLDGIIVYVHQAGEGPAHFTAGWKNRATREPADPNALFKIASISKLYVAVAAAKLINDESLSLDETLAVYLPELVGKVANADQITLRMLLQHRSGIPNFTDQAGFDWANPPKDTSESLGLIFNLPSLFAPDTRYSYSNTNFVLVGDILDAELGYSHRQYIDKEILAPLGLRNTFGLLRQVNIEEVVSGYHHFYENDWRDVEYVSPSGAMVATAQDVGIFLRALNDGSLLNDAEQAIYSSIYEYGHTGWVLGYQSIAKYHEDLDAVVVQFVNTTSGDADMELTSNVVYDRIVRILRKKARTL